ncbi:MAG: lamin tail domain-containing protein [Bradymonadales bacterium]|nr:lamin tail domain-containing protein [Bradymonadales bacterium]
MKLNHPSCRFLLLLGGLILLGGTMLACHEPVSLEEPLSTLQVAVSEGESIQQAIDNATPDVPILVEAGHFTENLTLRDGIILVGAGPGKTFLHGTLFFDSDRFGDGCAISGFTVTATGAQNLGIVPVGIHITRGEAIITDNIVEGFHFGLYLGQGFYGEAQRNTIRQNQYGISLSENPTHPLIANNLILFNNLTGIRIFTDSSPTVIHNTIIGNGFGANLDACGGGVCSYMTTDDVVVNNIIVSNNAGIIRQTYAASANYNNLVWGNTIDYADLAAPGSGDISLDPLFLNPGAGDFRLRTGSPAIDAGADTVTSDTDLDGMSRPQGGRPDLGAYEFRSPAATVDLVISEVLANPVDEDRGEFVEVYNGSDSSFDLAGIFLSDGDATDVVVARNGGTTTVAARSYAVIIDSEYAGGYDIPLGTTVVTVGNTTLGNGLSTNDPITLYDTDGVTILATYAYPFDPGNGVSAERLDLEGSDLETNWRSSPCTQSAGRSNCAPVTLASGLIISEIMSNPLDEASGEFIELYNGTDDPVDAGSMTISDGDSTDSIVAWASAGTVIPARSYAVVLDPDWPEDQLVFIDPTAVLLTVTDNAIGNGLAVNDPITLISASGGVLDTYTRTLQVSDGRSVEKVSLSLGDIQGNWAQSSCELGCSPGYLNCVSSASSGPRLPLVITEVMANPLDEDTGEFIELYNRGIDPVDAAGLILNDGDAVDTLTGYQGHGTLVPAGGYALIVDSEYAGDYDLPAGLVLLTTPDTTLGSSLGLTDPIRLLATNGIETIDSFRYPFNPGNGVSAERIDMRGFDSPDNWTASNCESRSSPGRHNCAASETGLPKQLRLTEIMSNQAGTEDVGQGEFIELINLGERSVDLAGMWLIVGPEGATARDGLVPYLGGDTVVPPGGFALIVDPQYDDRYDIAPGTVVLTIDDSNFGSSSMATTHHVSLYDVDGLTILDAFRYPSDPGDGYSLYRISLAVADSAANWDATPCGATPGTNTCPDSSDVTSYTSFWVDKNMSEGGIWWYQAIGWPQWYYGYCDELIVCPTSPYGYTYRDNFPAAQPFQFTNPYSAHSVLFQERNGPTHTCDPCGTAEFIVLPGEVRQVPASSLGYYYAQTVGPTLNAYDWFDGDPDRYWALPPDGILAPFTVEVPLP